MERDAAAMERELLELLPRLDHMARRVAFARGRPDYIEDLLQEAALAVLRVPPPWDEGRAMVTALNAMRDACRQLSPLSASPMSLYRYGQVRHATAVLWRRLKRRPEDSEIAVELHVRPSTVTALRRAFEAETVPPVAVGSEGDEQENLQHPGPSPEHLLAAAERRRDVLAAVARLSPVQRECVVLRWSADGHGPGWVAEVRGVNRRNVQAALAAASVALRSALHAWAR